MTPLFDPSRTVSPQAKPLPVLLLLDTSSSMDAVVHIKNKRIVGTKYEDGREWNIVEGDEIVTRIGELNLAVRSMISEFSKLCASGNEISLGLITFNTTVHQTRFDGIHTFSRADRVEWQDLQTSGCTSLGAALRLAKKILEDRNETPGRAYRPLVVLISDGEPTDEWRASMNAFVKEGRSAKCHRLALAVGDGEAQQAMQCFAANGGDMANASEPGEISRFFQFVTMSVSTRSRSQNPNENQTSTSLQAFMDRMNSSAASPGSADEDIDLYL